MLLRRRLNPRETNKRSLFLGPLNPALCPRAVAACAWGYDLPRSVRTCPGVFCIEPIYGSAISYQGFQKAVERDLR